MQQVGAGSAGRMRSVRLLLAPWVVREVRARYRQSAFDLAWAVITPVLTVAGYGLVLTRFFGVDGGGVPYLSFAWAGITLWTFVSGGLVGSAWSLVTSADLVRKVAFPRELVPVAAVAGSGFDLAISLILLIGVAIVQGIGWSATVVAAVPVLLVVAVWTAGVGLILATMTAYRRDAAHAVAAILRVGIFVTPVMYPVSQIPERYRWIATVNPVSVFIDSFRRSTLAHAWPDWTLLGWHSVGAVALFGCGLGLLRRVEGRLADVI